MRGEAGRLVVLSSSFGLCLYACAGVPVGTKDGRVPSRFVGPGLRLAGAPGSGGAALAASEEPGPAAVSHGATREYRVAPGDTLWSISRRFATTVQALLALNHLARPEALRAESVLLVPASGSGTGGGGSLARVDQPAPIASSAAGAGGLTAAREQGSTRPRYVLRWPVEGSISSRFGRRGHSQHDGIDIAAPKGTPIRAAGGGEILYAGVQGGYGNLILIRHEDGLVTVYAHQQVNLVRKGQRVTAGQLIGRVGETGRARGAHLHLEVRRGVKPENPLRFLPP